MENEKLNMSLCFFFFFYTLISKSKMMSGNELSDSRDLCENGGKENSMEKRNYDLNKEKSLWKKNWHQQIKAKLRCTKPEEELNSILILECTYYYNLPLMNFSPQQINNLDVKKYLYMTEETLSRK